jgi:TNF receptor-associated factor 4
MDSGEYQERTTTHLEECPMVEVPCPNSGCETPIPRAILPIHQQECLFELVTCKYTTIGCEEEVLRKDLTKHESDSEQHLQLAIDTIHQQQEINRKQENILARLQSREMPVKYIFTEYHHRMTANILIYSPPFYTSPGGYKMCFKVYANGQNSGRGTHVTVGAYLMTGENDDYLPWPFTGKLTVELLNQLEDKNHHCKDIVFLSSCKSSQRVVNEERSSLGWGIPEYISHSSLGLNTAKNCQYLKNDRLHFKISVDAKSSSAPWLI